MTGGDIAGLIAAVAFVVLVTLLAVPLLKLGKVLDEAGAAVRRLSDDTRPLITETTTAVTQVNEQMQNVDTITTGAAQVATNVSALTALFAATLGSPVVKLAAFTYGVRGAVSGRRKKA
ncbi:DUF948 domain-containing protein [Pseudokineococcus lusitanus]|jgi:uncharacterized protein YoxC|uniref:Uncharacterized protein DUF948 n=1 Tax=Pseudokineococcus lusitanus TaxID=763993 RepID=A0A3N1G9D0_9ACTN|nr:DUF948 domain-containing protein [Pseudokineococcus lusitanus]ROP26842.1 uncharacterized protein DUF948 [Pseudokineococcus lusitanus]